MYHPDVPEWIRSYRPPAGWTNVFSLVPSNQRLYGTETLFGDWNGATLLLAKDGAPTHVIKDLAVRGDPRPWRHASREQGDTGGYKTNEFIVNAASQIPGGKVYGSSTANLLCDNPAWSRNLPGFYAGELHEYLRRVLLWVTTSMPNLERIMCLGAEAWFLANTCLRPGTEVPDFASRRDQAEPIAAVLRDRSILLHPLYHPAARVTTAEKLRGWQCQATHLSPSSARRAPTTAPIQLSSSPSAQNDASTIPWVSAPFNRGSFKAEVRDSPIRKGMVAILKDAGSSGVPWKGFVGLGWRDSLTATKVRTALSLLAKNNGYRLEYRGPASEPTHWRIAR